MSAVVIDITSGRAAAVSLSGGILPVIRSIQDKVQAKHGVAEVALFHSVFFSRYLGFLAANCGVESMLELLESTTQTMRAEAPRWRREEAARRGKVH